jgi:hypothetical protein
LGAGEMDLQVILVFLGHLGVGGEDCGTRKSEKSIII